MSLSECRLIVGLGNPGKEYEYTRHNLGFLTVDNLAELYRFKYKNVPGEGWVAQGNIQDQKCFLFKPGSFMNNSGGPLKRFMIKKNIGLENLLVVCDDLHLSFGQLRLRPEGSDGGHNGLTSVIEQLGSREFARLRMGIGIPGGKSVVDYVLAEFSRQERKDLDSFIQQASDCCTAWLKEGVARAMSQFNKRTKE